jgi:hypothetical protein
MLVRKFRGQPQTSRANVTRVRGLRTSAASRTVEGRPLQSRQEKFVQRVNRHSRVRPGRFTIDVPCLALVTGLGSRRAKLPIEPLRCSPSDCPIRSLSRALPGLLPCAPLHWPRMPNRLLGANGASSRTPSPDGNRLPGPTRLSTVAAPLEASPKSPTRSETHASQGWSKIDLNSSANRLVSRCILPDNPLGPPFKTHPTNFAPPSAPNTCPAELPGSAQQPAAGGRRNAAPPGTL